MNYLAHLYLAQPESSSRFGNLLGDFMRGSRPEMFSRPVQRGLANHRWVDKFTDSHDAVTSIKRKISPSRRRFVVIVESEYTHKRPPRRKKGRALRCPKKGLVSEKKKTVFHRVAKKMAV